MNVTVEYTAQIKSSTGIASESLDVAAGAGIGEVISAVVAKYPELHRHLLAETGAMRPSVLLVLNGEQLFPDEEVKLDDGDVIRLLAPIAGGSF